MSTPLHLWPVWAPELSRRRFRFSPAIAGTEHNEWTLHDVKPGEVVVRNVVTGEELGIPNVFFGDVSRLEEPVGVVSLRKRLEHADGIVRPMHRAVIPIPPATDAPRVRSTLPANVVAIREEPEPTPRWKHYLRVSVALSCLACFIAVHVFREGRTSRVKRFSTHPARLVPHLPASIPQVPLQRK